MSGILKLLKSKSRFRLILFIFLFVVACNGCNDKPTDSDDGVKPVLSDLIAPDSLIKDIPDTTLIFVTVSDPQGPDNIDSVFFTVTRPDGSSSGFIFYMFDDGANGGDSVAGDGVYTQGIQSPTSQSQTGDYTFYFFARDLDGNMSDTLDKIIIAYEYDNPVITNIFANQFDSNRRYMFVSARVVDAQGNYDIERVWADITYLDQDTLIGSFDLNDFGNDGDSTALDNYYSVIVTASLDTIYQAGSYLIEFYAQDCESNQAVPAETTIVVDSPI